MITTNLYSSSGRCVGYMIHSSDFSGICRVCAKDPLEGCPAEVKLPGELVQAIRLSALTTIRERLEDIATAMGLELREPESEEDMTQWREK